MIPPQQNDIRNTIDPNRKFVTFNSINRNVAKWRSARTKEEILVVVLVVVVDIVVYTSP